MKKTILKFAFFLIIFILFFYAEPSKAEISQTMINRSVVANYCDQRLNDGLTDEIYGVYLQAAGIAGQNGRICVVIDECPDNTYNPAGCNRYPLYTNSDQQTETATSKNFFLKATTTIQMLPSKFYRLKWTILVPGHEDDCDNAYALWIFGATADQASLYGITSSEIGHAVDQGGLVDEFDYCYFKIVSVADMTNITERVYREQPINETEDLDSSEVVFSGTYNNVDKDYLVIDIYSRDKQLTANKIYLTASSSVNAESFYATTTLAAGNYSWLAYLQDADTGTTSVDFYALPWFFTTADPGGHTGLIKPFAEVEDYCNYSTGEVIPDALNKIICVLFIPDKSFLDDLGDSVSSFQTAAPLGYIDLAIEAVQTIATSAVATSGPAWLTASQWSILRGVAQLGIFSLFKIAISFMFLIVAAVYVFKRIKLLLKI